MAIYVLTRAPTSGDCQAKCGLHCAAAGEWCHLERYLLLFFWPFKQSAQVSIVLLVCGFEGRDIGQD